MTNLPIPRRVPDDGPRAFESFPEVAPGCFTITVRDHRHWPHLQFGEVAIIDARIREIIFGEVYAVRQTSGPVLWQVCRTPASYRRIEGAPSRPTAMLRPLNGPRSLPDGSLDQNGPLHLSDGPIYLDALERQILGRVVGVLNEPKYDPDTGWQRQGGC